MRQNPANARWWQWTRNGWVKLTLRPGQVITLTDGGPTDEGWWWRADVFTHVGHGVERESTSEALDCDGRLDRRHDCFCSLDSLRDRDMEEMDPCTENVGIFAPEWEERHASQRDYNAEAAGY